MDSPNIIKVYADRFSGEPVYYVNGIYTSKHNATREAEALALQVASHSPDVEKRRKKGIASLSQALTRDSAREDVPDAPAQPIPVATALGTAVFESPSSNLQVSFELAAWGLLEREPVLTAEKYPEFYHWRAAVEKA